MAPQDTFGWVGATLEGKVRVDAVVGEGGFGVVYRGHHVGFDEAVAVKCLKLPANLQGAERERFQKTFIDEGRLLHRLSRATAGIVQALDVGAATSPSGVWTPYLILEWLKGTPLDADLAARRAQGKGGRSLAEAIELLEPAARALDAAHGQGVAHRDVKPANLFIAEIGDRKTLKVLDFGIAKVLGEMATLTQALSETGNAVKAFTPQYGAPEQFHRKFGATGPWTDVFALALVLVEVVSGETALSGTDTTQLYIVSTDATHRPTLRGVGVETSDEVEAVLKRALCVEVRDRYHTAGAFWDALVAALPSPVRAGSRSSWDAQREPGASGTGPDLPAAMANMSTVEFLSRRDSTSGERSIPETRDGGAAEKPAGGPPGIEAPAGGAPGVNAYAMTEPRAATTTSPQSAAIPEATAQTSAAPALQPGRPAQGNGKAIAGALGAVLALGAAGIVTWKVILAPEEPKPAPAAMKPEASSKEPEVPPEMVRVEPGVFMMGSATGGKSEKPTHQVTITRAFYIDRTEVTAEAYQACVKAGKCSPSGVHGPKADEAEIKKLGPMCTAADPAKARHPITCVDREQAAVYCQFVGKRLPTEAEWEFAARGTDNREYPWGNEAPTCAQGAFSMAGKETCSGRPRGTAEVGSFAQNNSKSPFGALDMAGNTWEWVADGWDPNAYLRGWVKDPEVSAAGEKGVLRGGSWDFAASTARSTFRLAFDRAAGSVSTGFRCAKTVD
jgi:serine/threonine-protein kinase